VYFQRIDRGEMSRRESPNMPHKRSRISNEGGMGTPYLNETSRTSKAPISTRHHSLGGVANDQRQSSQMRQLLYESVNKATRQSARNRAMDVYFLNRLHINTPTPENVGNPSHQQNMFGKFILFLCFFMYFLNSSRNFMLFFLKFQFY